MRAARETTAPADLRAAEHAQRAFVRQAFRRDIDAPLGYDLVINLGTLPLAAPADLVIAALHARFPEQPRISP